MMCTRHVAKTRHVGSHLVLTTTFGVGRSYTYPRFTAEEKELLQGHLLFVRDRARLDSVSSDDRHEGLIYCREWCDVSNQCLAGTAYTFFSSV